MYRKLLVGYRDTEDGRDALALGKMLARATDAAIMVASVVRSRSQVDEAESVLRKRSCGYAPELAPETRVMHAHSAA